MAELLSYSSLISRLGVAVLLFTISVIIGFFYRKDFLTERKNGFEDRKWARHNQELLMKVVERDIESRERSADADRDLASAVTGLKEYLKGKLE